jgi:PAS domain S-box-containing protein
MRIIESFSDWTMVWNAKSRARTTVAERQALRCRGVGKRIIQAAVLLAVLAIAVSPCFVRAATPPSENLDTVVLQLMWYPQFQFAGYYAAQLKGYYAEEGLAVEIREQNPDRSPVDAVLSGEADFGTANSDILLLRMQGKPVVVLACIMQHSPFALLVRADSGIVTLEDFVGKTLAVDGNYRDTECLAMFAEEGISTDSMTFVKEERAIDDLINGNVDAYIAYISNHPFAMLAKGVEPRAIRPITYGIDFYGDTLFTSEQQIQEHPERVAAFRRASLRGWQYAIDHPEEIIDYILATYYADPAPGAVVLTREHLRLEAAVMAEELIFPDLVEVGHMNPKRWRRIADTYADMGMAESIDSLDAFIYAPNPKPDYHWFYVTIGVLMCFVFVGFMAWLWNKNLRRAVYQRTGQLRESNTKHERLVNNLIETFVYRHDIEGFWTYVSSSVTRFLGYSVDESLTDFSRHLTDHPVNRFAAKCMEQSIKGFRQSPYEIEVYHKDGSTRWLEVSETPIFDTNGNVVGVEGVAHNITRRKESEETMRRERDRAQQYLDIAGVLMVGLDREGRVTLLNKKGCEILGVTLEEAMGLSWFDRFIPERARGRITQMFADIMAGHMESVEYYANVVLTAQGEERTIAWHNSVLRDEEGVITGLLASGDDITDRKRAEEKDRKQTYYLEKAQELGQIGTWEIDIGQNKIHWTAESCRIYGVSTDSAVTYEVFIEKVHPDDREYVDQKWKAAIDGEPYDIEHRIVVDGVTKWVRQKADVTFDEEGRGVGAIGFTQDITGRKQAEEERERATKIQALAVDAPQLGVWDWNLANGEVTYDERWVGMLGYAVGELRPNVSTWKDLLHPEDKSRVMEDLNNCIDNTEDYQTEFRLRAKSGQWIWIMASGKIIERDDQGNPVRMVGVHLDITDRKQAEKERERVRAFMQTVIDGVPGALMVINLDHTIALANREASQAASEAGPITSSLKCYQISHDRETPCDDGCPCPLEQVIATKEPVTVEHVHHDAEGNEVPVEIIAAPIFDDKGEVLQVIEWCHNITERKKSTLGLMRLKAAMEQVPVGVAVADGDLNLYFCNAAGLGMRGSGDQLVDIPKEAYKNWRVLRMNGEPYEIEDLPLVRAVVEGIAIHEEFVVEHHDGSRHPCDAVASPILDKEGNIEGAAIVFNDITDRKRAEEKNRKQTYYLEKAQELGQIGTWEIDIKHDKIYWTEENCRIFGVPVDSDVTYEVFIEKVHPDDREYVDQKWKSALEGESYDIEHRVVIDGVTKWVRERADVTFDEEGRGVGAIGFTQDITDRKRNEELLRQSEAFIRTVLDNLPTGLAVNTVDPEVTFSYMNDHFPECYRTTREALSDPDAFWNSVYEDPEFREEIKARILADCASGDPERMHWEDVPITRQGQETAYVSARNVLSPGGEMMISTVWDVTDRKRAEEERKKLEAQFLHSQKMDAIGQLAGGVAHDFNNLLGGIVGYADLLKMDLQPDSSEANYAEEILTAASRAADLTQQLLTFSRRGKMQTVNVDVHSILDEVVALLQRSIDKKIDIVQHFEASPAVVSGDPTELQSAILNLAVNGRDAMPEGGQLTFSTRTVQLDELYCSEHAEQISPGLYVEIDVTDTGVGMDIDVQQHVFEPFFTTKEQGEGTGLGLASVYGCVKDHLGAIRVYSEPGLGSTFKMLLPLSSEVASVTATVTEPPVHGHGHILVIDDEEVVCRFTDSALTHLGYNVSCCYDGEEGVAFFREHYADVDLVVLDMIMPGLGGEEVFRLLKEIDPDVRVLIDSGFTQNGAAEAILDDGALGFLGKPFLVDELSREIARCLADGT